MYKYLYFFLFIILSFSCKKQNQESKSSNEDFFPRRTVITGKIDNHTNSENLNLTFNRIASPRTTLNKKIDSLGNFKIVFSCYSPIDYWFSYKDHQLLITTEPGDSTHITFNANNKKVKNNFAFSGSNHITNTAITEFQDFFKQEKINIYKKRSKEYLDEKDLISFKAKINELKKGNKTFINNYGKKSKINSKSKNWIFHFLESKRFEIITNYIQLKKTPEILSYFYDELSVLKNDSYFHKGYNLRSIVNRTFDYYYMPILIDNWEKAIKDEKPNLNIDSLKFNIAISHSPNNITRELLISELTHQHIEQGVNSFYYKNEKKIYQYIHTDLVKKQLNDYLSKVLENKNPNTESELVTNDIIKEIISKNQGKVIYVDFWTTWCAPCRKQIPLSLQAKNEFHKNEVVFVYVCLESSKEGWENLSNKLDIPPTNNFFIENKDAQNKLKQDIEIKGYPHYILIDKKGNITKKNSSVLGPATIKKHINELLN